MAACTNATHTMLTFAWIARRVPFLVDHVAWSHRAFSWVSAQQHSHHQEACEGPSAGPPSWGWKPGKAKALQFNFFISNSRMSEFISPRRGTPNWQTLAGRYVLWVFALPKVESNAANRLVPISWRITVVMNLFFPNLFSCNFKKCGALICSMPRDRRLPIQSKFPKGDSHQPYAGLCETWCILREIKQANLRETRLSITFSSTWPNDSLIEQGKHVIRTKALQKISSTWYLVLTWCSSREFRACVTGSNLKNWHTTLFVLFFWNPLGGLSYDSTSSSGIQVASSLPHDHDSRILVRVCSHYLLASLWLALIRHAHEQHRTIKLLRDFDVFRRGQVMSTAAVHRQALPARPWFDHRSV